MLHGRVLALDRALARALARDRARDLALALALDRDLALARARARALDLDRYFDFEFRRWVMGSALSHALADALRATGQTSDWPAEFCKAFADAAGISGSSYVVSPDALAGTLGNAVQALNATLGPPGKGSAASWAATVSERFQETAIRVFDRQAQLTPGAATSIRLAALCLAAEADALRERQVGEAFRHIAAGVTLLERRANGDDPATETIILASE